MFYAELYCNYLAKTFLPVVELAYYVVFRRKTTEAIMNLVEYSNMFAAFSNNDNIYTLKLLDNFARHLFAWRRPYPKFRQSQASAHSI